MKISRLDLTSFKSFAGATFDLRAPRTLIAGLNASGKTSTRESMRYVLTGKAQGLDGKGSGQEHLIPKVADGDGVKVSAWIDGVGSVTRSWLHGTSSLEVQGFTGTPTEQQAALYEKLGTTEAMLTACLDSSVFLDLHHAEAKALVLQLLNVTVPVEIPASADRTEEVVRYTLDQLDAAYAKAFEDRKAAKQKVKGAFVPPSPVKPETSVDLAAIETRLKELRGSLAAVAATIAGTEGQKAVLDRQLVEALTRYAIPVVPEDLDAQIEGLEERLAAMEADTQAPVPEPPPLRAGSPTEDPARVRSAAEKLIAFDPSRGCVLDGGVKCPVAKLKFTNRGKDLLEQVRNVPREGVESADGIDSLQVRETAAKWAALLPGLPQRAYAELAASQSPDDLTPDEKGDVQKLRQRLSEAGQAPAEAVREMRGSESAEAPSRLQQAITRGLALPSVSSGTTQGRGTPQNPLTALRTELQTLKSRKIGHQHAVDANLSQTAAQDRIRAEMTALPDVSEAQARIETLQGSLEKGAGVQKAAQAYHTALQGYEQALAHKQTLDAEVVRLEGLVQVLGPSGARVKALGDALGRFEAAVNGSLLPFGWAVHFEVEPWQVVVNGRPVETYSRSEQHRIGIALQVAIAELSGIGFAVVDELDMLDAKNRETMGVVLLRSALEQVIILGTREAESPLPKGSAALASYRIGQQDGRSVILERGSV